MLSIGKLAAGQARYYLDHAESRVDVVERVGDGIADYYVGGTEARGAWIGTGAARLGLAGPVGGAQLRQVLGGLDPGSATALRTGRVPVRVAGFDLTFSAPKSVSIVFGLAEPDVQRAVRAAHDRAVVEAVGYVERTAAKVPRGAGGAIVVRAHGLVAAAFRHRTSRAGDPQLHTHVLVANLGRGPDGRWSALDARAIYAHARTASFVYQAVLRSELTRTLGIAWGPVRKGIAEIDGVPARALRVFSRRRAEIEAALTQRGVEGPRAAEAAALATRQRKDRSVTADELAAEWRQRAAMAGLPSRAVSRLLDRTRSPTLDAARWAQISDHLAGTDGLTKERSTFGRAELIEAICQALPAGAPTDARTLESAADDFLASRSVVALVGGTGQGTEGETAWRRRDGRVISPSCEERPLQHRRAPRDRAAAAPAATSSS